MTARATIDRLMISIHALREEGDEVSARVWSGPCYFYPRPPRGGRHSICKLIRTELEFLSTPSARRATRRFPAERRPASHFYPRPPRGGRRVSDSMPCRNLIFLSTPSARRATHAADAGGQGAEISIHALREEGDERAARATTSITYFYPRPPRGGRRRVPSRWLLPLSISIHALREEGDRAVLCCQRNMRINFYPRPPRGGRPRNSALRDHPYHISIHALREEGDRVAFDAQVVDHKFLSTPSARRATYSVESAGSIGSISIHALREEGDSNPTSRTPHFKNFYPRPPRGGRLDSRDLFLVVGPFLSTPSARRATRFMPPYKKSCFYFYPRPPRGGRQQKQRQNLYFQTNYTTFCTNLEEP